MKVGLRPVDALLPHEETIPEHLRRLKAQLTKEGEQKDPLIVDSERGIVLDGMHRLAAFREMGIEYAVCGLVEYSSSSVKLFRWVRSIRAEGSHQLQHALEALGKWRSAGISESFEAVEAGSAPLAILRSGGCLLFDPDGKRASPFELIRSLDAVASSMGWRETFVAEEDIDVALQEKENALLLVPALTKQDVVRAATTGDLLPHKTTLHVIELRPVAINFPLKELRSKSPPEELLKRKLSSSAGRILPINSSYGGRRYKERLMLLSTA